jgi:hypothetical protein
MDATEQSLRLRLRGGRDQRCCLFSGAPGDIGLSMTFSTTSYDMCVVLSDHVRDAIRHVAFGLVVRRRYWVGLGVSWELC